MSRVHRFDDYYNNTVIYIIIIDFLFFTFLLNYTIYNVNIYLNLSSFLLQCTLPIWP